MNLFEKQPDIASYILFSLRPQIYQRFVWEYIRNTFLSFLLNFLDVLELKLLTQRTKMGPNANLASQLTIVFHKVELA